MAESFPPPDSGTGVAPDRGAMTSPPAWVKVFGAIAFVLALLFLIVHLTGRGLGGHSPVGGDSHKGGVPASASVEGRAP